MDATNQQKILAAGFTIIRKELDYMGGNKHRIKYKGDGGHEWKTFEKDFFTKASLERRMKVLLQNPMIVED